MTNYYLIGELPEKYTVMNEKYAPQFGFSTHFNAEQAAEEMGVQLRTAIRRIETWIYEGYCKEVI